MNTNKGQTVQKKQKKRYAVSKSENIQILKGASLLKSTLVWNICLMALNLVGRDTSFLEKEIKDYQFNEACFSHGTNSRW